VLSYTGDRRRHRSLAAVAVCTILGGAVGLAQKQYPIFTADQLSEAMKTVGLAFGLTNTAISKNDFPLAKDYVSRARDQLATTLTFWRDRKIDEAIEILRTTLKQLDALDAAMSAEKVDAAAVVALHKQAAALCETCHAKYREQDPTTKAYRVRSELLR